MLNQLTTARLAGIAGLGYIAGVAIENMAILEAPTIGSPAEEIRSFYADSAFVATCSVAGSLALLSYCVLAVALFGLLRGHDDRGMPWALIGLAGGIAGPVVAALGLTASGVLASAGQSTSDDVTRALFDFYLTARIVSGIFVALFLAGVAIAALRTAALPRLLAYPACALAVPMALAPVAAFAGEADLRLAVAIAFACQSLWIFWLSLWLLFGQAAPATFVRRCAFLVLVLAAGLVGLGLLAAPGGSSQFFAWGLGPEPLAAFAGGVYVGSAAVYAAALTRPRHEVAPLVAGAVLLSVSVTVITFTHLDQFDFGRLQALAWVVLFVGFSVVTLWLLVAGDDGSEREQEPAMLTAGSRGLLAGLATVLAALALALWADPGSLSGPSPFDLPPLGGRFAGSWVALLALIAGWAAWRGHSTDGRLARLALVLLPLGALVAALRTTSDLDSHWPTYAAALALLAAIGTLVGTRARDCARTARAIVDRYPAAGTVARRTADRRGDAGARAAAD